MKSIVLIFFTLSLATCASINFEGIPNNSTLATCEHNTEVLNMQLASLETGDTFIVPNTTYCLQGGVQAHDISDVVFQLDGTLSWTDEIKTWPRNGDNV